MIINAAKAQQAAGILGVELDTLSPDLLSAAYRTKTKEHHPDVAASYDAAKWADIAWAKEVLVRWLESRPVEPDAYSLPVGDCKACGGAGRVVVSKAKSFGGKAVTVMCVMCNGSGHVVTEPHRATGYGD